MSFATLPYFGVNSFKFTNVKGDSTFVRYQMEPEGDATISHQGAARGGRLQLSRGTKFASALATARCASSCKSKLPSLASKIEDPSIAWPDSRKTVDRRGRDRQGRF